MDITQIYQDKSLCGDLFVSLPQRILNFTKDDISFFESEHPGERTVRKNYFFILAQSVEYHSPTRHIFTTEFLFEKYFSDIGEFIVRRFFGSVALIGSLITFPIGFATKVIHACLRDLNSKKIGQIWNNTDLIGHCLTAAPKRCYEMISSPLNWHLRADGSDRRSSIQHFPPKEGVSFQQGEYQIFPFEVFEFFYKRVYGSVLLMTSIIISPLGLVAKAIHLSTQSAFSTA